MPITIVIRHVLEYAPGTFPGVTPADLTALETRIMSALTDKIAELKASADAAIARDLAAHDALNAKVAELQAKVDAGTVTLEDLAALNALKAELDGTNPPPAPAPPAPAPPA